MANTRGVAPICNAPPEQPTFFTKPPVSPNFSPPTASFPSLVQSILHLQMAFQTLTNQQTVVNNTINGVPVGQPGFGGGGGVPGFGRGGGNGGGGNPQDGNANNQQPDDTNWKETSRQTENVKVVNPDDDTQFVIVTEITSITFQRKSTGETIIIKRDP